MYTYTFQVVSSPQVSRLKLRVHYSPLPCVHVKCPNRLIFLHLMTLIMFDEHEPP